MSDALAAFMRLPEQGRSFIAAMLSEPVLVAPGSVPQFLTNLMDLAADPNFARMSVLDEDEDDYWSQADEYQAATRPYPVKNGVLRVPIWGALSNGLSGQYGARGTGYPYIQRAVERGVADPDVHAIALVVDSTGGEAAGNFELARMIRTAGMLKPVEALVHRYALSGGYSLASAGRRISVTNAASTGSVGAVVMHAEVSGLLESNGIKVNLITAGAKKVDGNPYQPLSESARRDMQARVDKAYARFVSTVSEGRALSEKAVKATEAGVYDAEDSIEVGFADAIVDASNWMAAYAAETTRQLEGRMSTDQTAPVTEEEIAARVDAAVATARTEAAAQATAAERERVRAVFASETYAGREKVAAKMLTGTSLSAEEIVGVLAEMPKEKVAVYRESNAFAAAMDRIGGPEVGGVEAPEDAADAPGARAEGILANYRAARGASA